VNLPCKPSSWFVHQHHCHARFHFFLQIKASTMQCLIYAYALGPPLSMASSWPIHRLLHHARPHIRLCINASAMQGLALTIEIVLCNVKPHHCLCKASSSSMHQLFCFARIHRSLCVSISACKVSSTHMHQRLHYVMCDP